jgi:hypothetical protein
VIAQKYFERFNGVQQDRLYFAANKRLGVPVALFILLRSPPLPASIRILLTLVALSYGSDAAQIPYSGWQNRHNHTEPLCEMPP